MAPRLRPRSRDSYDNEAHGRRESTAPPDDRTVNPAIGRVQVIRPKYNEGPMIIRPWPALDFEKPNELLVPGRKSARDRGLSHWIIRVPMAKYIGLNDAGCERVSFILYRPQDSDEARNGNPYRTLFFACKTASKAGEFGPGRRWDGYWNAIMQGKKGQGAEMPGPTAVWMTQGVVFVNGDKDYIVDRDKPLGMDKGDDLVLIQIPETGGSGMRDLLDIRKPDDKIPETADEEDRPWEFFRYGDPTGLYNPATKEVKGGLIFTIFNPRKTKIEKHTSWDGQLKDNMGGYEAAVAKSFKYRGGEYPADLDADQTRYVFDRWQFWWDDEDAGDPGLLRVPSTDEQCLMVAKAFSAVPKLLEYGWADHPEFMTDDVKAVLRKRRAAVMPGEDETDGEEAEATGARPKTKPADQPATSGRSSRKAQSEESHKDGDDFDTDEAPAKPSLKLKPKEPAAEASDDFEESLPKPKASSKPASKPAAKETEFEDGEDNDSPEDGEAVDPQADPYADDEAEAESILDEEGTQGKPADDDFEENTLTPPGVNIEPSGPPETGDTTDDASDEEDAFNIDDDKPEDEAAAEDEEDGVAEEAAPDEQSKANAEKMRSALKAATGRSGQRSSTPPKTDKKK